MKKLILSMIACFLVSAAGAQVSITYDNPNGFQPYSSTGADEGRLGVGFDGIQTPVAPLDVRGTNIILSPEASGFSPFKKFAAMGESGGSCNSYGFSVQVPTDFFGQSSVEMMVRTIPTGVTNPNIFPPVSTFTLREIPTISYQGGQARKSIFGGPIPEDLPRLDFLSDQDPNGCGDLIMSLSYASATYKMTVYGSARASGGTWVNSDARFKNNIQPIESGLDMIGNLRGVTYDFKRDEFPQLNFNEGTQYGFIAQELAEVMPTAVMPDEEGYFAVNYDAVIPVLVNAIQEQQSQIEALQEQIELLQGFEPAGSRTDGAATKFGTAGLLEGAKLEQNAPNPFRSQTEIGFFVPQEFQSATLYVFDLSGRMIKTYPVTDAGAGSVMISAGELTAGMYIYTLSVNGAEVDSKRMILTD